MEFEKVYGFRLNSFDNGTKARTNDTKNKAHKTKQHSICAYYYYEAVTKLLGIILVLDRFRLSCARLSAPAGLCVRFRR